MTRRQPGHYLFGAVIGMAAAFGVSALVQFASADDEAVQGEPGPPLPALLLHVQSEYEPTGGPLVVPTTGPDALPERTIEPEPMPPPDAPRPRRKMTMGLNGAPILE